MKLTKAEKGRIVWALEREAFKWSCTSTDKLLTKDMDAYRVHTEIELDYLVLASKFKPAKGRNSKTIPQLKKILKMQDDRNQNT